MAKASLQPFLREGMKLVDQALDDLGDAPMPAPQIFEWKDVWEEMTRESSSWEEDRNASQKPDMVAHKAELDILRKRVNVYLFSRINQPSNEVLKPLRDALNAECSKSARVQVEALISN